MPASSPGQRTDLVDDNHETIPMGNVEVNGFGSPHDADDEAEDNVALLGSRSPQPYRRGEARSQTKNIVLESAPTLLLTTISLLFTGKLLDQVSRWRAMREVDQLIMIIPVVLNLKGNLEMNLSARLGTAANRGKLSKPKQRRDMIIGNLALLQVQAAVVSFVAACIAIILGLFVPHGEPAVPLSSNNSTATIALSVRDHLLSYDSEPRKPIPHPLPESKRNTDLATLIMVASTTMSATCLSGILLGSFMCTLIVLCLKFDLDPDNIAPAIASCLGDLVTLCLIGLVSTLLIPFLHTPLPSAICVIVIISASISLAYTLRNEHVRSLLGEGWTPLFGAMVISSGTGVVLDMFVSRYEGFPLLAVVISGLPGAAGSIFVSRLSTALHALVPPEPLLQPHNQPSDRLVMLTLLLVTLPVEVVFLIVIRSVGWLQVPAIFIAFSMLFFCCAVFTSLVIARLLTNWLWSIEKDPDMYALPIHSAMMDLVGQLLLVLCFEIVSLLGGRVEQRA